MAYTEIHPIKSTLDKALEYICNPEKTDGKILISSFGCSYETAAMEFQFTLDRTKMRKGDNLAHLETYPKSTELNAFELPVWEPEDLSEEEPAPPDEEESNPYEIRREARKYQQLVQDIYAFNNSMFAFIDMFVEYLDKMDKAHYAEALYKFSTDGFMKERMGIPDNEERIFSVSDTLSVQYVPRKTPDGSHAIYECFHVEKLQSFLKLDFYRALMAGHIVRRCKNCKLFFLSTNGIRTKYCDRPIPGKPHRNCRNQGAKNIAKEKAKYNAPRRFYEQAYNRVNTDCNRGRITKEERDRARKRLIDLRDEAISGKYRDKEVEALMKPDRLYPPLKIERK